MSRVFVSIISGLLFTSLAFVAAWLFTALLYYTNRGTGRSYFHVRDEVLGGSFLIAAFCWAGVLGWTWRNISKRRSFIAPLIGTLLLGIFTVVAGIIIDETVRREEEYLIAALCMLSGAIAFWLWFGYAVRLSAGRPIVADDGNINVVCPNCAYSLVGLRELRCPECGQTYTLDEIIRKQDFDALRTQQTRAKLPSS